MIGHTDTKIISDANLPYLVRQMAVHADVSVIFLVSDHHIPFCCLFTNGSVCRECFDAVGWKSGKISDV